MGGEARGQAKDRWLVPMDRKEEDSREGEAGQTKERLFVPMDASQIWIWNIWQSVYNKNGITPGHQPEIQ
jgi:hypothetical protein